MYELKKYKLWGETSIVVKLDVIPRKKNWKKKEKKTWNKWFHHETQHVLTYSILYLQGDEIQEQPHQPKADLSAISTILTIVIFLSDFYI